MEVGSGKGFYFKFLLKGFSFFSFEIFERKDLPFQLQCLWHNQLLHSRENPFPTTTRLWSYLSNLASTLDSTYVETSKSIHHFCDGLSERSSLDVFGDEVYSLVFIKQSFELQNIGMVQTAHHLNLFKVRQNFKKMPTMSFSNMKTLQRNIPYTHFNGKVLHDMSPDHEPLQMTTYLL